jgi:rhamnogalacturonyl hydrolase YesR
MTVWENIGDASLEKWAITYGGWLRHRPSFLEENFWAIASNPLRKCPT